jgi:hypothetical protein
MKESKFDPFYDSLVYFLQNELSSPIAFSGIDMSELNVFESNYGFHFNESIKIYFNRFGKHYLRVGYDFVKDALDLAARWNTREEVLKTISVDSILRGVIDFEPTCFFPIYYDDVGSVYQCILDDAPNPVVYYYWGGGGVATTTADTTFIDLIRDFLFIKLSMFPEDKETSAKWTISLNGKRHWSLFHDYREVTDCPYMKGMFLYDYRYEFCRENAKLEKRNDKILTIDEFEINFVKFLIEEKNIKYNIDKFNPYDI